MGWREVASLDGVTMRHGIFGKGAARVEKWEIFVDGKKVDYAVNARDAEVNFFRAVKTRGGRAE